MSQHERHQHDERSEAGPAPLVQPSARTTGDSYSQQGQGAVSWQRQHSRRQLIFNGLLLLITALNFCVNVPLMCATKNGADTARTTANTARKELELAYRPWLTLDVNMASPVQVGASGGLTVSVRIRLKNIGKSAAVSVHTWAYIYATDWTQGLSSERYHSEACGSAEEFLKGTSRFPGNTINLMPGEQYVSPRQQLDLTPQQIAEAQFPPGGTWKAPIVPVVAGCVVYRFTFSDERLPRTSYAAWLFQKGKEGASSIIPLTRGAITIPIEQLILDDGMYRRGRIVD
jgi:hypothetical protein